MKRPGIGAEARVLIAARSLRAFGDGYVSLLLPFYLTTLGYSPLEIGLLATATLVGSGLMTLGIGFVAHRYPAHALLRLACFLMIGTGIGLALLTDFWPLLLVAFIGTMNPTGGDVSVFLPIEHSLLARSAQPSTRTALFARYSVMGVLVSAFGAQAAGLPQLLTLFGVSETTSIKGMFLLYGALGIAGLALYRRLPAAKRVQDEDRAAPLGKSKRIVYTLAALFSLDAFAGGFVVQSLLALWLYQRFGLSAAEAGTVFFLAGLLGALSQLIAVRIAKRIGLVNTMVFTHLPSNLFTVCIALAPTLPLALTFLFLRALLSQMDVPARTSYVMAVVSPAERAAAASLTNVPRSLAAAVGPALAGSLLAVSSFGWPLVICGTLKTLYDLLLLKLFRGLKPPEEEGAGRHP